MVLGNVHPRIGSTMFVQGQRSTISCGNVPLRSGNVPAVKRFFYESPPQGGKCRRNNSSFGLVESKYESPDKEESANGMAALIAPL